MAMLSALHAGRSFTPKKHYYYYYASGTHFCSRLSKPQSLVRPERLGKSMKIIQLIRSRTRDHPTSSIAPQPLHYRMPPSLKVAVIINSYGVEEFRGLRKDLGLRARVDRLKKQRAITLPNTGLLAVIVIQTPFLTLNLQYLHSK
jgi:hypothetical protein